MMAVASRSSRQIGRSLSKATIATLVVAILLFLLLPDPLQLMQPSTPLLNVTQLRSPDKAYSHGDHHPFLPPAAVCTEEQRNKISQQLGLEESNVNVNPCQQTDWLDLFYEEEADIGSSEFVGISIGCNTGNDAVHAARMGMSDPQFDDSAWQNATGNIQGACPNHLSTTEIVFPKRDGEMHCVEAMPMNFEILRNASDLLGLDSKRFVVVHAAMASRSGRARFPDDRHPGKEDALLTSCDQTGNSQDGCADVDMYSLFSYVEKFVQSKGPISMLSIDTEGMDFEVLFGAGPVLDRTNYIEFEYHVAGTTLIVPMLYSMNGLLHLAPNLTIHETL